MKILKSAFIHLKSKNGFDAAAVLSFSTLFAIVPLFALVFSIFSLSPYFADLQQYLDGFLFEQLLPKNHQLLSQYIHKFIDSAQNLKGISSLFLLLVVIFLFREVDGKINSIFGLEKTRHLGIGLLIYLLVLILGPLLLALSLFISSYLNASKLLAFAPISGFFAATLPIILSAIGLALLYYFIPSTKISFKNAIKSGLITAFFLEALKLLMLIYISYFPFYQLIYGALSTLPLFMLWVYFSWILVLFGASISFCFHKQE
ncbi:MAG: YihY family inner membrane protein [Candidatus Thioglobus sp.]|nr:MAG: YihY family inner membrane protein [Candidatus Thioglobus sp.]